MALEYVVGITELSNNEILMLFVIVNGITAKARLWSYSHARCWCHRCTRGAGDDDAIFTGEWAVVAVLVSHPISSCCSRLCFRRVELKERKIRVVTTPNRLGRVWHASIAD